MATVYEEIFAPLRVGNVELRNRVVVPPMVQCRPITSPEGIAWYRRLAAGGAGLVIVEATGVPSFGSDLTRRNLRPLVEAIHDQGAAAAIQLFPIAFGTEADPNSLSPQQLDTMVDQYDLAAVICRDAEFDGVEPHGAHGFLINQFFMPDRNQRGDEYGGSLANRCRLAVHIVDRIKRATGDDLLILYRHTPTGEAYSINDSLQLARRVVDAGVDVLDISPARQDTAADLAAPFKAACDVPVIAVGGMDDPDDAVEALRGQRCDLVAVGRQLIADAEWPVKVEEDMALEITQCQKCDVGCHDNLRQHKPVECAQWVTDEVAHFVQ